MVRNLKYLIFIIAFALMFGVSFKVTPIYAKASTDDKSVLTDLKKDSNFNSNDYPEEPDNYVIELIQVAETEEGDLAVYVYNPSNDSKFNAKKIRLSQTVGDSFSPRDYDLTLVSEYGVFGKYLVDGLSVKNDAVRYYNIVCIFRDFIEGVDKAEDGETLNYITYMPFEVAKCYTATTLNGEVTYTAEETEVVTITGKYVGFIRYTEGAYLWDTLTDIDRHFVAFSCDYDIDKLCEAELVYSSHKYDQVIHGGNDRTDYPTEWHEPITLYETDEGGNVGGGAFGHKFTWKRIESTSDFMSEFDEHNFEWTDGAVKGLSDTQWVLSFAETEVRESSTIFTTTRHATKIDEVSILRLKFVVDGQTFNLGVVDNYQGNSNYDPSGGNSMPDWQKYLIIGIVALILIIVVVVIIAMLAPWILTAIINILLAVIKCIGKGLLYLLKGIWWLITLPFRGIAALFKSSGKKE